MSGIKTYSEQIIEHIKQMLLRGELQPGDKVNEVHLAAALAISRAPIREALQLLSKEGLIVSIPQRGKFIKNLSTREIKESYFIGGVLEGTAVGASAHLFNSSDFKSLEALIEKMKNFQPGLGYTDAVAQVDMAFHDLLLSRSENKLIVEHARSVCQRLSKFLLFRHWPLSFSKEEIVARHQEVLQAVRTKDIWTIEQTIRLHYSSVGERMAKFGNNTKMTETEQQSLSGENSRENIPGQTRRSKYSGDTKSHEAIRQRHKS